MTERVAKLYPYLLLAPALLPLFYLDGVMYPMLAPKTLVLRALGIVVLAVFVYLKLSPRPFYYERLRAWQTWIPGALLLLAYLTSLVGVDFYHSFWSTFERGDGLLTLTVCVGYFYLLLVSLDDALAKRLLKVVAWVGSIAGAYVIVQWFFVSLGVDLSPVIAKTNGRVGGTMGNAAFLAAYLGMSIFVTLAVARDYYGNWRTALYVGAALQLVGILLAATRGTILALIVVGFAVLLHEAMRGTRRTTARKVLAGAAVLAALFIVFRGPLANVPFEPVRRIASISLSDGTVSSRLFLWSNLLPEALRSPVVGVGAEHVSVLFNRIYEPTKIAEEWFDRSHNAYLDYFIQFGILGLALYLALIVTVLMTLWRLMRTTKESDPWQSSATYLFLGFAVYALQNFFVFDTGVTLWLLLALAALVYAKSEVTNARPLALPPFAKWVGVGVGALLLLLLIPVVIQPARANLLAFEAYLYHVVDVPRTNTATAKGLALSTYADLEYGYNAYFMYTNEQLVFLNGEPLKAAYENAYAVLKASLEHYPYDARTAVYLLHVIDSAPDAVAVDRVFQTETIAAAIALSPKRAEPWYMLANLAIEQAKRVSGAEKAALYDTAIKALEDYVAHVPMLSEPHFVLADLYLALGDRAKADAEATLGRERYVPDFLTAKRAAAYYEKTLDLKNAKFFLEEILTFEPGNEAAKADLATIEQYEKSGR